MPTLILVCVLRGNCVLTLEDGGKARRSNTLPTWCRIPKSGVAIVCCHRDSQASRMMVMISSQHSTRKLHLTNREPILLQWSNDNFSKMQVNLRLVGAMSSCAYLRVLSMYNATVLLPNVWCRCSHIRCTPGLRFNRCWRRICKMQSQYAKSCSTASRELGRISRSLTVSQTWKQFEAQVPRPMTRLDSKLD